MTVVQIARRPGGPCAMSGELYTTTMAGMGLYRSGKHYCRGCGEEAPIRKVGPQAGGKQGNYVFEFLPHDRPERVRRLVWMEENFFSGESFDNEADEPDLSEGWIIEDCP